jgi:hypothetical protein
MSKKSVSSILSAFLFITTMGIHGLAIAQSISITEVANQGTTPWVFDLTLEYTGGGNPPDDVFVGAQRKPNGQNSSQRWHKPTPTPETENWNWDAVNNITWTDAGGGKKTATITITFVSCSAVDAGTWNFKVRDQAQGGPTTDRLWGIDSSGLETGRVGGGDPE